MEQKPKIPDIINFDIPQEGKSKYIFLAIAFVVCLVEIVFLLWFVPNNFEQINQNSEVISKQTEENKKLEDSVLVLNSTNQTQLNQDLLLAESGLPSEKRVTGLVSALTYLASSSGVVVDQIDISFGNVSTKSATKKPTAEDIKFSDFKLKHDVVGVPIVMKVLGDDSKMLEFVGKVQQALPLLDIRDVTISLNEEGAKEGQLSVLVYSQPGDKFTMAKIGNVSAISDGETKAISTLDTKTSILQ